MLYTSINNPLPTQNLLRASDYKALQTTRTRALTMEQEGYAVNPIAGQTGLYLVTGGSEDYTVDVCAGTCNCPLCARVGECKHLIYTLARVKAALEFIGVLIPAAVPAPIAPQPAQTWTVNGKTFATKAEARAYEMYLDFA